MHIVLIPAFFRERKRPTLGEFFWQQALALQKAGHELTILYCDTFSVKMLGEYLNYQENTEEMIEGVHIYRQKCFCPMKHGLEGHRKQFEDGILRLYDKYITKQQVNVDIIHAHCSVWAGAAARRLSQAYGIPYVITEHSTLFQLHPEKISRDNQEIIARCFQDASKVICVSQGLKQIISDYVKEIEVIGNVVDCSQFQMIEKCKDTDTQKFTFFSLCYMQTEAQLLKKGIDVLIQAVKRLQHDAGEEFQLLLGGGGPAITVAKKWVAQASVESAVQFLGALDRSQVVEQMQACDCFVLPSRYETFGVVYIEAMACGKPVIGVKNGGPDGFVNKSNGILLEDLTPEKLAMAMTDMIKNRNTYNAGKIRESTIEQFSQESIARQLTGVYQKVVKHG